MHIVLYVHYILSQNIFHFPMLLHIGNVYTAPTIKFSVSYNAGEANTRCVMLTHLLAPNLLSHSMYWSRSS